MTLSSLRWDGIVFRLVGVASFLVIVAGLSLGYDLFVPLALAILLTLVLLPAVGLLQRTGLPRVPSVVVVVALAFGLLGGMGYFVVGQLAGLASRIPEYQVNVRSKVKSVAGPFSAVLRKVQGAVDEMKKEGERPPPAGGATAPSGRDPLKVEIVERGTDAAHAVTLLLGPVASVAGSAAVVVFLVVFLLIYQNEIRDRLIRLAGGEERVTLATQTLGDAVQGVSRFLFLQALLNVSHGAVFGLGLFALGVPNALLWGFTATLLRFIPYLGPVAAGLLPLLLSIAIFPGWGRPGLVALFIVALELVSNNLIEPWVYGKRTGLSPFAVVVAAIFWAWLWGPMGLLLSVPLTVCLMTLGKYVPGLRFLAVTLGDEPAFGPELQIYNRLLMGNLAEAAKVVEKGAEGKSLPQVYDGLLMPVLRLADEARHQGRLDPARLAAVLASLADLQGDLWDEARLKAGKEPPPEPRGLRVLCLPVDGDADAAAGSMLAQMLTLGGFDAEAAAPGSPTSEKADLVEKGNVDVVVLSAFPTSTPAAGRFLYKRIRRRLPGIPIVIGAWGLPAGTGPQESPLDSDGRALRAATLIEAEAAVGAAAPLAVGAARPEPAVGLASAP